MKKTFRIAALALAVCGLMAACNNAPKEELVDTMPIIDTTVVEELIDTMPVVDTPAVAPAPAKKASAQKTPTKKVVEDVKTVKKVTLETKKDIEEIKGDLKEVKDASSTTPKNVSVPGKKAKAADAFKKN